MIFEYGNHQHPDAEVYLKSWSKSGLQDGRGNVWAYDITLSLGGNLRNASGTSALLLQKEELETVYAVNNQRATLYSNNDEVLHRLDPRTSITGVQVLQGPNFPDLKGGVWTTTLPFEITLAARIEAPLAEILLQWDERIDISRGLPKVVYLPRANGQSTRQVVQKSQPWRATQSGTAVGRQFRPSPPPRAFGGDMIEEKIGKVSPSRLAPGVFREFSVQWSRTFISNNPLNAEPSAF